jgi:hypothetical protein
MNAIMNGTTTKTTKKKRAGAAKTQARRRSDFCQLDSFGGLSPTSAAVAPTLD